MVSTPDYSLIFQDLYQEIKDLPNPGKVATYIPELGNVSPDKFGIHLSTVHDEHIGIGDCDEPFSIQSIAKVLSLTMAYEMLGEEIWERVDVEPSGDPFNSLVQLEYESGIPRNPMINAGALVISDILVEKLKHPKAELLDFIRAISDNPQIDFSERIAESEKATSYRNASLINLMKSFGNIRSDIEVVLDFYFSLCSIMMSCRELSRAFLFLAHHGNDPCTTRVVTTPSKAKRLNAIMQLCGFYDEAGEFSFRVGLPGKSGVGGGIAAVYPGQYSIAVWSPPLNPKGNSYRGMRFLEELTTRTADSIF